MLGADHTPDRRSFRVLQVLQDTSGTSSNLNALRFHANLVRQGDEVRTLAITPGNSRSVSALVPTMAPSAGSIAATTQLRREMRWPDVVALVDCLPRWITSRRPVPLLVNLSAQFTDSTLRRVNNAKSGAIAAVVVQDESCRDRILGTGFNAAPVHVVRTPVDHLLVGPSQTAAYIGAARAAARAALGLNSTEIVVVGVDSDTGAMTDMVRTGGDSAAHRPRREDEGSNNRRGVLARLAENANCIHGAADGRAVFVAPEAEQEILLAAADVVVVTGESATVPALLIDLMVSGAVPLAVERHGNSELLVHDETAVLVEQHQSEDAGAAPQPSFAQEAAITEELAALAGNRERLARLSGTARETVLSLCHPDEVQRQWSALLSKALPSLT